MAMDNSAMTKDEAIRLGEKIRERIEELKNGHLQDVISFEQLLMDLRSTFESSVQNKENIKGETEDKFSHPFSAKEWEDKIKKAFVTEQIGISIVTFDSPDNMKEHLLENYNEEEVKGNSYIVKKNNDNDIKYEIGIIDFEILGFIHEIAHIAQGDIDINRIRWNSCDQNLDEISADIFARSFWMPRKVFEKQVINSSTCGECRIDEVARHFCVSVSQIYLHGQELCLWK